MPSQTLIALKFQPNIGQHVWRVHVTFSSINGRIENYDCFHKPGLLRILRQNPNLTLLGSYHKAEPYQLHN